MSDRPLRERRKVVRICDSVSEGFDMVLCYSELRIVEDAAILRSRVSQVGWRVGGMVRNGDVDFFS